MSEYKYLLKNVSVLAIGQFSTKILSFFMVPLYTSILTTEEYGTYDVFYTTISLLIPILTCNISAGVMRFALEKDYDKTEILSVGMKYLLRGAAIVSFFMLWNTVFELVPILCEFGMFFWLLFAANGLLEIVMNFVRGMDEIAVLSAAGVLGTVVTAAGNLLFLIPLKSGLPGYFTATILGIFVQCIYMILKTRMWKYVRKESAGKALRKQMLAYSVPMIANSVAWWINSVSDKYIVVWFCGLSVSGVYAVASRIPSVLNVIQTIFNQAWTLSAVRDYDEQDESGFISDTYNFYHFIMVTFCSALISADKLLAGVLYAGDFYLAWKYVPFLLIAMVFGAMSGHLGGIFSAVKRSEIYAQSTIAGAAVNVLLNMALVPVIGAFGAAIATAVSYWLVWVIRRRHVKKYITLRIRLGRDYLAYVILGIQTAALLLIEENPVMLYGLEGGLFCVILLLYVQEIRQAARMKI